jgi:uncharacterized protein YndB with AHSA1/START domain
MQRKQEKLMGNQDFTTTILVDQSPEQVFAAINNVRRWWPEIEGRASKIGETFMHRFGDMHQCELVVKDVIPGRKVVWTVIENYFGFTEDKSEWKGTDIIFAIRRIVCKTELKFTHVGLVPQYECYGVCANGWNTLINGDLRNLITSGSA